MTFFDLASIINSGSTNDMMFKIVEEESGQSLFSLRKEIEEANKCNGRYPRQLREKIAQVRRAIDGMDGYEQITRGTPTALGYKLNNYRGLDLPWEVKSRLKQSIWQYLLIDEEKDKDSIGVSLWKSFYEGKTRKTMADTTDDFKAGCGCIFFIALAIGGIVTGIKGCCDEKRSESLRPDYSSRPSEEGLFEKSGYGFLDARGFRVADGIGYLTLNNGHVLKMWRNSYGEYEGRYNGKTYMAKKTANGYEVRSKR